MASVFDRADPRREREETREEAVPRPLQSGPFFQRERFTLVDAVFGPIFRYFDVFEGWAGLRLLDGLPRTGAWRVALAERPACAAPLTTTYPELLGAFLKNRKAYIGSLLA